MAVRASWDCLDRKAALVYRLVGGGLGREIGWWCLGRKLGGGI